MRKVIPLTLFLFHCVQARYPTCNIGAVVGADIVLFEKATNCIQYDSNLCVFHHNMKYYHKLPCVIAPYSTEDLK